jgi:aspartate/methionine/tyrosine aminotransferase
VLDLTMSNPTRCELQYDEQAILSALANPATLDYTPEPKGLLKARRAIAEYYSALTGAAPNPERILLTTSTSEAYSFVFRLLCDGGDELLVPAPSYPLFEFLADLQDVRMTSYPLFYDHGWHVDLHALKQAVSERTRALLVVHPNNPTGSYLKPPEVEALNTICAARELAIVADEVFLDYACGGARPASFVTNHVALTFTLSGLSKVSALPQMKVAWIVVGGPAELAREATARLEVIADTYLSMNTPVQLAIPSLLQQRHDVQRQLLARVKGNLAELDRQLAAYPAYCRLQIEGGWYAVLRVPATQSDEELAISVLEKHGVLVHPGHFYDFAQDGFLVLSLITREWEFAEGVKRVLSS